MQNDPPNETPSKSFLGLERGDQFFLGLLFIAILILFVLYLSQLSRWGTAPVEIDRLQPLPYEYQIEINQASWVEFAQLNRIGPVLARKIVAHRETHGPFRSIEDLLQVKGIGPKTLNENRMHLKLDRAEQNE